MTPSDIHLLLRICATTRRTKRHTVIVFVSGKDDITIHSVRSILLGACQENDTFSGRTLLFEEGGAVSVVSLNDTAFLEDYDVYMLSYSQPLLSPREDRNLAMWTSKATNLLTPYKLAA